MRSWSWVALLSAWALGSVPHVAQGQDVQLPVQDSTAAQASADGQPTPAGAFLRGALIPGWGHTVSGASTRGAFYFGVEAANGWMLYKSIRRLRNARQRVTFIEGRVTSRLRSQGIVGETALAEALDADADVLRARTLVESREEQREDWIALTLFFLLVSGVDAFVSAHLQDFPEPLTLEPSQMSEGLEIGVSLPVDLFWN